MRIILLCQYYLPDTGANGQLLSELAAAFVARGHEVHVVCSRRTYGGGSSGYPSEEEIDGVLVHRVKTTGLGRGSLLARVADSLCCYVGILCRTMSLPRADACLAITMPPFVGLVGCCLRWRGGTSVYLWVMDVFEEALVTFGVIRRNRLPHRFLSWIAKALYRRTAGIVSLGEEMTRLLVATGAPQERIKTIHNWMPNEPPARIPVEASQARRRWGLGDELTVMYSGNMGLGHELITVVRAIAEARRSLTFRVVFVGSGQMAEPTERLCRELRLEDVSFYPPQPLVSLPDTLAAGHVHLVGQGISRYGVSVASKLYGVLAVGRPTLFIGPSDCTPARLVQESASGLVVPAENVGAAADALCQLLGDPAELERMGRRARRFYEEHLGRARSVGRIIELIERPSLVGAAVK